MNGMYTRREKTRKKIYFQNSMNRNVPKMHPNSNIQKTLVSSFQAVANETTFKTQINNGIPLPWKPFPRKSKITQKKPKKCSFL